MIAARCVVIVCVQELWELCCNSHALTIQWVLMYVDVLEPVKTLVLRYNTSVVNCVVKLRLVSVSNFYCNAGPNSCNNYSS